MTLCEGERDTHTLALDLVRGKVLFQFQFFGFLANVHFWSARSVCFMMHQVNDIRAVNEGKSVFVLLPSERSHHSAPAFGMEMYSNKFNKTVIICWLLAGRFSCVLAVTDGPSYLWHGRACFRPD